MPEDLLDISRKAMEDVEGTIRNLRDMKKLSGRNQVLHENALRAAEDAFKGVKELNEQNEGRDARALAGLLQGIDLKPDFLALEQKAAQELEAIRKLTDRISSPDLNKEQINKILVDLEAEIRQMQNAALAKGIGLLATIARVTIPLL
jgi:hypothetical protein